MAERNRPHIILTRPPAVESFTTTNRGNSTRPPSPTNRVTRASQLTASMRAIEAAANQRIDTADISIADSVSGIFVQFESFPGFDLALKSLAPQEGKIPPRLYAVSESGDGPDKKQYATVFLPDGWVGKFLQRFDEYATQETPKGQPKRKDLVERIAEIRLATLRAMWTDDPADFPADGELAWWELWLQHRDTTSERVTSFAEQANVRLGEQRLIFDDRMVVLVQARPAELAAALDVLDELAELRRPSQPTQVIADLEAADQAEFVEILAGRLLPPSGDAPRTCIIDSGVSSGHSLISPALDDDDMHVVNPAWGLADLRNHGTPMAGKVLYGDLGTALLGHEHVQLTTRLESVKILPDVGENDRQLYGALTAQSTSLVEIKAPNSDRTFVLAVTGDRGTVTDDHELGEPTAWSATIDALAAGREVVTEDNGLVYLDEPGGRNTRLFVLCVGNVRGPWTTDHLNDSDSSPADDPAQAWNALTVGAYTQFDHPPAEPVFSDWKPLASEGELSPFSRTTVGFRRQWRFGPDVVFEGGNAAISPDNATIDTPPSLQVLTTKSLSKPGGLLTTMTGTSPATALAAGFIAEVRSRHPALWPETLRALCVQSARWTDTMLPAIRSRTKADHVNAVRRYGWGVPNLARALRSANDSVTLIAERTIHPFLNGSTREMHLHDLPWPADVLSGLGETQVTMRVALSYFVEPNPARRGWTGRYLYPSHGLRFDVRRATESTHEFRQRINRQATVDGEKRPPSNDESGDWLLGSNEWGRGSFHVDEWTGTAADLAARGCVAVFPVAGWWKEQRKRDRSDDGVHYSLVVSIETPEIEADIWTPVAVAAEVPIVIET